MNNKGGIELKEALIFIAIMCLCILITMVSYNKSRNELFGGNSSKNSYQTLEKQIKSATSKYIKKHYGNDFEKGENEYITITTLIKEGYMEKIYDPQDRYTECSGYTNVYKKGVDITYKPYIKCGSNYQTKEYNKDYDI